MIRNTLYTLMTLALLGSGYMHASPGFYGQLVQETFTNFGKNCSNMFYFSQSLPYTQGGLTFTYPTGLFTNPPTIQITIQSGTVLTTTLFTPMVTSNSATSTTVYVNASTLLSILEATSSQVTVHLVAIGN